jgi:hypothetical protein
MFFEPIIIHTMFKLELSDYFDLDEKQFSDK